MWETEKLRLPEGAVFTKTAELTSALRPNCLRSAQDAAVDAGALAGNGQTVPLGKDGEPLEVKLVLKQAPKSSVFVVEASSSNPAYTQAYLDSLMNEYLEYKKNVRKVVSGDTLASISEQVLRLERDLKADQDALTTFERIQQSGHLAGRRHHCGGLSGQTENSTLGLQTGISTDRGHRTRTGHERGRDNEFRRVSA
jgi:hypothetical protein